MRPQYGHPPACTCVQCNPRWARQPPREGAPPDPRAQGNPARHSFPSRMLASLARLLGHLRPLAWMLVGALVGVLALPFLPDAAKEYVQEGQRFADSFVGYARELARTASPTDSSQAEPLELEALIHSLVNSQRAEHGLPLLAYDEPLSAIARSHSDDMASQRFFSHVNPAG